MFRVLLACLLLAACSKAPAPPLDPSVAPKYIGVLILYLNGEYIHGVASNKTYDTTERCLEVQNKYIAEAIADGKVPEGGNVIGACIPIPALKKAPKQLKPTPQQGIL